MKKFFLIPLLALFSCVMAFAAVRQAGSYTELQSALSDADCDEIQLTADFGYPTDGSGLINITKSITINGKDNDGNIHTISGYGSRGGNNTTIAINNGGANFVAVTLKDLIIRNNGASGRPIETRGKITSLTLDNVSVLATGSGNPQGLTIGGKQATTAEISIINSQIINQNGSGYPVISFNPYHLTANNSTIKGYCSLYFKGIDGSAGSRGSVIDATDCNFDSPNIHYGRTNGFGTFVFEDGGITLNLHNCGINAEQLGNAGQYMLVMSSWANLSRRNGSESNIEVNISGDNTYINGEWASNGWSHYQEYQGDQIDNALYARYAEHVVHETGNYEDYKSPYTSYPADQKIGEPWAYTADINLNISGGTYAVNPSTYAYNMHVTDYRDEVIGEETVQVIEYSKKTAHIVDGYEVKEIETQQGGLQTTLYRVRKKITTSESINDNVEGQGAGVNANTEFLISGDETVAADATVAHYVEVSNDATLTLPAGKELTVKNGLDVTDGAVLDVQAGSTLIVGEGGVTAESVNSIVVEADENGSASFLLDPEVIVNTTPNITIKMTAKGVGYEMDDEEKEYYWFRFAAPVAGIQSVGKAPERPTYFYKWDYAANDWSSISALGELEPFQGFSLSTAHEGLENVEYTFQGRLAGNQDMTLQFKSRGYNYFGNSYTGYLDVLALVQQLMDNDAIDGTVYMWNNTNQKFQEVPIGYLAEEAVDSWKRQVAPMQTFILRQVNTGEPTSTTVNYASAIWGNPRYGLVSTPTPSPAPKRVNSDVTKMTIVVTSANGKIDEITFKESDVYSDEYEKGFDAVKFMNERQINLYTTIDNENLGYVATDNIEGKLISMQTVKALNYTMSFENVNTEAYAIRDNVTGAVIAIEEGATYEFAAQPNSVVEGRFEIVSVAKMPTAIENTEVKANVKGIYTLTGQYVGEDFKALPAGVYVVNGVKIVK